MKREVTCNNGECDSVVLNAYGPGQHFHHVMLVDARETMCPACRGDDIEVVREVTDEHRFALGSLVTTPGAAGVFNDKPGALAGVIKRHVRCDWGEVDDHDAKVNISGLGDDSNPVWRSRLMSIFTVGDTKVWVMTEAGHHATTVLLPDEY